MDVSRPHSSVVEHFLGKEEVTGSSPVVGSILCYGERIGVSWVSVDINDIGVNLCPKKNLSELSRM